MLEMVVNVESCKGKHYATYTNARVSDVSLVEEQAQLPWKQLGVA